MEKVKVAQLSCQTLCNAVDHTVHGILQTRILEWVAFPFSRGSSQPRDQTPGLPHCRQILYIHESAKPPGKPKNTGVSNLSLLQRIFPTQELNQDLQHYRQILYQLSHQESALMRTHCDSVLCDILSTLTNGSE